MGDDVTKVVGCPMFLGLVIVSTLFVFYTTHVVVKNADYIFQPKVTELVKRRNVLATESAKRQIQQDPNSKYVLVEREYFKSIQALAKRTVNEMFETELKQVDDDISSYKHDHEFVHKRVDNICNGEYCQL